MQNEQSGLLATLKPYLPDLWKAKFVILGGAVASAIAAYAYTAVQRPMYAAHSTLLLPTANNFSLAAAIPFLSKEASQLSILNGIASSSRSYAAIAKRERLNADDLVTQLTWTPDSASNQLIVSYASEDKEKAVQVLRTAINVLGETSRAVGFGMAKSQSDELKVVLDERVAKLTALEDSLLQFQKNLKSVPDATNPLASGSYFARLQDVLLELNKVDRKFEIEREAAIRRGEPDYSNVAPSIQNTSWKQKLSEVEYELRVALTKFGPSAPEVEALRRKLRVTQAAVQKEVQAYVASVQQGIDSKFVALEAERQVLLLQKEFLEQQAKIAPKESLEFQRLLREITTQTEVVSQLRKQYETAKIDGEVYKVQYTVLQAPWAEEKPFNKDPKQPMIFAGVIGLLIGSLSVIGSSAWRRSNG